MRSNSQIKILFLVLAALLCSGITAYGDGRNGLTTVCIDPGHGGKDPGCVSADGKTREKDLTLSIAKTLADEIKANHPGVKVVMTRSTDTFVSLSQRADIANKAQADLFISIHINASTKKGANGFSLHCLGQSGDPNRDLYASNMDMVKRENAVILLEEDYSSTYQGFDPNDPESFIFFNLMQNAHLEQSLLFADEAAGALAKGPISRSRGISQDPFLVLWRTAMPAVLVECGFMSNASDLAIMKTEANRKKIAHQLYVAFSSFKKKYDSSLGSAQNAGQSSASKPAAAETASAESGAVRETAGDAGTVRYGTQVLASARKMKDSDPFFKGYTPFALWTGKVYKYIIGVSDDLNEAREESKKIKKKFPDSFLVKIEDGKTEIVR